MTTIGPEHDQSGADADDCLRELQEAELATRHRVAFAEFALAREAELLDGVFRQAGLRFDPGTFVALRVLESCIDERLDPVPALRSSALRGLIDRATELTATLRASRA